MRIRFLSQFVGVIATVGATSIASAQVAQPNIILIISDDQGWTESSVQMDPAIPESRSDFYRTAWLEQLANDGMRFSNAYVPGPMCTASRAGIMTGKSPAQLQMTDVGAGSDIHSDRFWALYVGKPLSAPMNRSSLPLAEITIAERLGLASGNYRSGMVGKWSIAYHDRWAGALNQGFDYFSTGDVGLPPEEDPKDIFGITQKSIEFIEDSVDQERPFFVVISHQAVHYPFEARPEILEIYENLPGGQRHDDPVFAAMLHDMDLGVGMVLERVSQLGLDDNTYVFYISDNGAIYIMGDDENDPLFNCKGTVYEGGIRVPFIVRGPGIEPGSVSDVPVTGLDIFSTISALVDIEEPLPAGVEGTDISPVLFNGGELPDGIDSLERLWGEHGELYFHFPHYVNGGESPRRPGSAIRDGQYKLVRLYAEPGEPADSLLLFDFAQSVEESGDVNSPLNLSDDLPKVAESLNQKLEDWLQAVDASQAYDVASNVELTWDAALIGNVPENWRTTNDVQCYFRELWQLRPDSESPQIVDISPHPLQRAYRFDGDDGMQRRFFRVSDPRFPDLYDADHSATFEFWLRIDAFDHEQVLFESGDSTAGLSITIGDADSSGEPTDVRVRALGSGGNSLTATGDLSPFAATERFIQLVAVISDDPDDRYISVYLDGCLIAHAVGTSGTDEIDWDGLEPSGIGRASDEGLGGDGGSGDQPFSAGNFIGQLARFRFSNYALSRTEIIERFVEVAGPQTDILAMQVNPGSLLEGDLADLIASDDEYVHMRSGFGSTLSDLHNVTVFFDATALIEDPICMDLIVESRLDNAIGSARIQFFNWQTGQYDVVGSFAIGTEDQSNILENLLIDRYVGVNGEIALQIQQVVQVPFLAYVFESYFDRVNILVR